MSYYNLRSKRQKPEDYSLIGPFLPSIWKDIIFPWLNIEDLAMLRRVCRFFRDDKRLNEMLDSLKSKLFKNGYFENLFNRKLGIKTNLDNFVNTSFSFFKDANFYCVRERKARYGNSYFFFLFTSKDMMIRFLKTQFQIYYETKFQQDDFIIIYPGRYFEYISYKIKGLTKQDLLKNNLIKV